MDVASEKEEKSKKKENQTFLVEVYHSPRKSMWVKGGSF